MSNASLKRVTCQNKKNRSSTKSFMLNAKLRFHTSNPNQQICVSTTLKRTVQAHESYSLFCQQICNYILDALCDQTDDLAKTSESKVFSKKYEFYTKVAFAGNISQPTVAALTVLERLNRYSF